jgi:hypothetical protein
MGKDWKHPEEFSAVANSGDSWRKTMIAEKYAKRL